MTGLAFALLLTASMAGFRMNHRVAFALREGRARLHSLDTLHGFYALPVVLVPAFVMTILGIMPGGSFINASSRRTCQAACWPIPTTPSWL